MEISTQLAYISGLLVGKGYLYESNSKVAIEFSHSNPWVNGIVHCDSCGYLATKNPKSTEYICKNQDCRKKVDPIGRSKFNQIQHTHDSLRDRIVPFLDSEFKLATKIIPNRSSTLLVLDFSKALDEFAWLLKQAAGATNFSNFHLPEFFKSSPRFLSLEFLNGVLDATGYPNAGNWLNRDGASGHGRMRVYIQIVRNWHLTAELDEFIRQNLELPVQTIDWGHPNIRDSKLQDYRANRHSSWSREHQIKFFPEYFDELCFKLTHKQQLFAELLAHNVKCEFPQDHGWFPPSKISDSSRKAIHPSETDPRLPLPVRRHFDAFWQLSLALGSESLREYGSRASSIESFGLTGDPNVTSDQSAIETEVSQLWMKRTNSLPAVRGKTKIEIAKPRPTRLLEKDFYFPIASALRRELDPLLSGNAQVFDTSAQNLSSYLRNLESDQVELMEEFDNLNIRPDLVGFEVSMPSPIFVEVKIDELELSHLGQILGYCAVAQPRRAILISTESMGGALRRAILKKPKILEYGDGKTIQIAQFNDGLISYV